MPNNSMKRPILSRKKSKGAKRAMFREMKKQDFMSKIIDYRRLEKK